MKKVLINVEERELRVAILEDDQLVELYIESLDEKSILNNIYKGRIEDVLPGLKAAFVNIGLDRNAFLHFDDVRPDLLWGKYRELNPEMADEVPTAREALAAPPEGETEDESDDRRKRRRGRRGGKKRRPDAEETYTPGLPVGVTEDDLEDEDDEEHEIAAAPARPTERYERPERPAERFERPEVSRPVPAYSAPVDEDADDEADEHDIETSEAPATAEAAAEGALAGDDEAARRQAARMEKQRQRRERWEQKKLERQQRRQAQRAERQQQSQSEPEAEATPPPAAPTAYGTRGSSHATDNFAPLNFSGQQRRSAKQLAQDKARYGDNFGNIAVRTQQRHDFRDSQADFFGPSVQTTEDHHSIWDDRQPDLGPVPGLDVGAMLGFENYHRRQRGSQHRRQGSSATGQHRNQHHGQQGQGPGQGQGQNKKRFNKDNKRRGGKKRNMRKRDNRSFFALSADDLPEIEKTLDALETSGDDAPAKKAPARKRAAAKPAGEKAAASKPAAKKPAAAAKSTSRKKKSDDAAEQVPAATDIPAIPAEAPAAAAEASVAQPEAAPAEKPKRTRAPRKPAAKKTAEPAADAPTAEAPVQTEAAFPAEAPASAIPAPAEAPAPHAESTETSAPAASPVESSAAAAEGTAPEGAPSGDQQPRRRETRAQRFARIRREKAAAKAQARAARENGADPALAPAPAATDASAAPTAAAAPAPQPAAAPPAAPAVPVERPRHTPQHSQQQGRHGHPRRENKNRIRRPQFQEVFKKGDELMVQVVKEEIGLKGARISSYVSLPGRYLVLLPYPNQEGGISRKVEDLKERKRLKNLLQDISSDETAFIIRTAGIFQEEKEIRNDVEFLSQEWGTIAGRYRNAGSGALVYDDHDILYRLARDVFDDSVTEIQIDSHTECEKLKSILGKLIPGLVNKVKLYSGNENIFHKFGVTKQIQKAARRKVWLKSGGYLIIDEAEALTAIDVNTGKSVGKDDQEKLILRTNLESARAVARELKLRDIGGLIVIDFIDMKDPRNREQVLNELKMQLRKDRSKTSVSAISEFGLVEMTRKRVRRSLRKTLFMDCPYCQGAGVVLNEQQIWLHIKHEIVRQLESTRPSPPSLNITVNPRIRAYIDQNYRDVMRRLEQKYDTEIRISMSDIFHIENYQIEKSETTGVISGSATMPTR